jgi:hypothetical protein
LFDQLKIAIAGQNFIQIFTGCPGGRARFLPSSPTTSFAEHLLKIERQIQNVVGSYVH